MRRRPLNERARSPDAVHAGERARLGAEIAHTLSHHDVVMCLFLPVLKPYRAVTTCT